jgi:hypothetical protein
MFSNDDEVVIQTGGRIINSGRNMESGCYEFGRIVNNQMIRNFSTLDNRL